MRLKAEFAKARVRRGCASVEQLKAALLREKREADGTGSFVYPRWVRINNICTTLEEQIRTTFSTYQRVDSIAELAPDDEDQNAQRRLYIDPNIPDLVAVPYGADFTSSTAYKKGEIILQDKASCFPAYLLLGDRGPSNAWEGDLVDGCAAPGNKTTHMASLLAKQQNQKQNQTKEKSQIFSMDASVMRSKTLQKMVSLAGADSTVIVLPGQDFLALDPTDDRFANVSGLLLDPSCSGSGIIGRDDVPNLTLPRSAESNNTNPKSRGKKRKRKDDDDKEAANSQTRSSEAPTTTSASDENDVPTGVVDQERLVKLSNIQARIVEHALTFPNATHVTYSTCSIHLIENECVVARILTSDVARQLGWRLLRRDEQPQGLRNWKHRGVRRDRAVESALEPEGGGASVELSDEALEACLRCWSGDAEGLGGFFVAGFVRDPQAADATVVNDSNHLEGDTSPEKDEDEWEGFSD